MTDQSPTREEPDRYAKLRTIPDYIEGIGKSSYLNPEHPYSGQIRAANKEYADDLRALLAERDALLRSDSQRIAELEGRLNGLSQGATVAHPSVRPDSPNSAGAQRPPSEMPADFRAAVDAEMSGSWLNSLTRDDDEWFFDMDGKP